MFENNEDRTVHTKYHLPIVEIKDSNVMIDGQNFFHGPIENDLRTYDNIQKIVIGQGGYYTTGYLLDYSYFNSYYEL